MKVTQEQFRAMVRERLKAAPRPRPIPVRRFNRTSVSEFLFNQLRKKAESSPATTGPMPTPLRPRTSLIGLSIAVALLRKEGINWEAPAVKGEFGSLQMGKTGPRLAGF